MSSRTKRRLVLIDGHSNIFKAYHAIKQSLTNSKGEPTSAVYGFVNSFLRLHRDMEFDDVVVVFDPPGPSFRKAMYGEYKANRPPMPDDLRTQEVLIREWLEILGMPVVQVPEFEADDVLAALAIKAVENGGEAIICSVDKDLLQVVRPGITIWREHLQKVEVLDEEGVVGKMGVKPDQVPEFLGLVGDSSDNIPGVPGIGKKTAATLLQEHGSIAGVLEAIPKMMKVSKALQNLVENQELARLSTELATLRVDDCPVEFDWDKFAWRYEPDEKLRDFYLRMEFRNLVEDLPGKTVEERVTDYRTITTVEELKAAVVEIKKAGLASIDTETDDLDTFVATLVGISLSWKKNQAVYLPINHSEGKQQLTLKDVQDILGPALADDSIQWVAHHWGFDYKILKNNGLPPARLGSDTMVAAYLLNPDRTGGGSLRLKDLSLTQLGIKMTEISELIGTGDDLVSMASVSVDDTSEYACQDADVTLQLHHHFMTLLKQKEMEDLYTSIEVPLVAVLSDMELCGVRLDREHFRTLSKEVEKQLATLTEEIYEIVGRSFNINSPKQLATILFEEIGLDSGKKGKSGTYSTDVTVLEGLRDKHPLPAKLLEYRGAEKLKNTYIDPLPGMIHAKTGLLHTSYNQTVAATGRLSSSNPNLQNIPIRTEAGRAIRQGFLPLKDGWKLLAADYSQVELRILAHLSDDESLIEAFRSERDIHTLTASKVFGIDEAEVTSKQRSQAKAINFGIIYGMTEFRLARDMDLTRARAKEFINEYFRVYSGVKAFIDGTVEQAKKDRYVATLMGRRRHLPDINSQNFNARSMAERIAVNTPIQGTNADMIKIAMIRIAKKLRQEKLQARMILQVHDELIFDAPEEELPALKELVISEMTHAIELKVPIKVETEIGDNWAEC